jgi:predicted ferric reductase
MTNFLPKVISAVCLIWLLSFPLLGGGSKGKHWYGNLAADWIGDSKGGVPMLMIAMPLLLMSSMAAALAIRSNSYNNNYSYYSYYDRLPRIFHRFSTRRGDVHWNKVGLKFILIPLLVYLFSNMYRHLNGHYGDYTYSKKIMEVANAFGMMAVVSTSFLLVPVCKQGPLLRLFGIDQIQVTCLHIWCGRIFVIGSILHGGMHMYRWHFDGESIWNLIFPPAPCWTSNSNNNFKPKCVHSHTDCTCYHHFRNLTGFVAVLGMIVMLWFSLHSIRRHFYKLFYMSHILAAPLVLIATVMHYNKAIMYIAGSLLYYLACSVPGWIESRSLCRKSEQRIQIVSVQNLQGAMGRQRPCLAVTIAASEVAIQRYQPGMYVYVSVPEISLVSHPVTINTVPNQPKQLRIMFRQVGPWTRALGKHISTSPMFVSGFYGCPNRVAQVLQHDVSVIVAAGIGITPYLSLLSEVLQKSQSHGSGRTTTAQVMLHWICRDAKLVDYVRKEYFEPLLQASSNSDNCRIRIMVHRTDGGGGDDMVATMFTDEPQEEEEEKEKASDLEMAMSSEECSSSTAGVPFNPSRFSVGSRSRRVGNLCGALAFFSIAWLGLGIVWYCYSNVQQNKQVSQRIYAPLAILLLSLLVAALLNVVPNRLVDELDPIGTRRHQGEWFDRVNDSDEEDDSSPIEMTSFDEHHQRTEDGGIFEVSQSATIVERKGRPTIADLLEGAWDARSPGLFCCGPPQLVRDLHTVAEEHCFGRCVQAKIAVYDESFQI